MKLLLVRANAVPQGGGPFKVQLLRRLRHLLLHLPGQGPVVSAEDPRRLLNEMCIRDRPSTWSAMGR